MGRAILGYVWSRAGRIGSFGCERAERAPRGSAALLLATAVAVGLATAGLPRAANAAGSVILDPCLLDTLTVDRSLGNTPYSISSGTVSHACETVGDTTDGELDQTGGTNTVTYSPLTLGAQSGSQGLYELTGGTLNVGSIVTGAGIGNLEIAGGTLNFATSLSVDQLTVGGVTYSAVPGSAGSLSVGAGQTVSALTVSDGAVSGEPGSITMNSGSSLTTQELDLGLVAGSSGTFTLNGGNLSTIGIIVGRSGTAVFDQTGGTNSISNVLDLGKLSGGSGTYQLSAGALTAASESIGAGSFIQSGGTNKASVELTLGGLSNDVGIYTLDGGTLTVGGDIATGPGAGFLVLDGGTLSMAPGYSIGVTALFLGRASGTHGSYTQRYGNVDVAGSLFLGQLAGANGTYTLQGGSLAVGGDIFTGAGTGTLNLDGGTFSFGNLLQVTTLNVGSSALANVGFSLSAGKDVSATNLDVGLDGVGSFQQDGGSVDATNLTIAAHPGSAGSYALHGGTLTAGSLTNNGAFDFSGGTLALSGAFANNGTYDQAGGILTLPGGAAHANAGTMDLDAASQLRVLGAFTNRGSLDLGGAQASGTALLDNTASGTLQGPGTISSPFANEGVVLDGPGTLRVAQAFQNSGSIELGSATSILRGGAISNSGKLQGIGVVTNDLTNSGGVEALGGTLTLSGAVTNGPTGLLTTGGGSELLLTQGLAQNQGVIDLAGGTFDTNGQGLANAGQISGFGTLRSGGLTNAAQMLLGNGPVTVNGPVVNQAGGRIEVANGSSVFTGAVDNLGTFKSTNASVAFAGGFTNGGVYISDPSTQSFGALMIDPTGYLMGGAGDVFRVSSSFTNHSQQNTQWNTDAASLVFDGGTTEAVLLAGLDEGATRSGYHQNFSWGSVELANGTGLDITNAKGTAAWYVGAFTLDGGLSQLASITSGVNIYYDPTNGANSYLGGKTYALQGGGFLMAAVPEPSVALLLVTGLIGLAFRRRRTLRVQA